MNINNKQQHIMHYSNTLSVSQAHPILSINTVTNTSPLAPLHYKNKKEEPLTGSVCTPPD